MSLGTVCLLVLTVGSFLPGVATLNIHALRDRLKVGRIYAHRVPTKMVEHKPFGNWAVTPYVGNPVG